MIVSLWQTHFYPKQYNHCDRCHNDLANLQCHAHQTPIAVKIKPGHWNKCVSKVLQQKSYKCKMMENDNTEQKPKLSIHY